MKPTYKTLAPRQKELYQLAVMDTIIRGKTTTEIIVRLSFARNPALNVSTLEGWDIKARSDARYVIQAMRNDGWVETVREAGQKTATYRLVRK